MFGEDSEDKSITKTLIEAMVSMKIGFIPLLLYQENHFRYVRLLSIFVSELRFYFRSKTVPGNIVRNLLHKPLFVD